MSSWWCIKLYAFGDLSRLEEFKSGLPSLFHVVEVEPIDGQLGAEVAENYGGAAAIENVVHAYPDLMFSGTMIHEQAQPADRFWGFVDRNGTTEWREFSLPDEDRHTSIESSRNRIAHLDRKIARLTEDRDFYLAQVQKREAEEDPTNPSCDLTGDTSTNSSDAEEILAIVDKIKARTKTD